MRLPYNHLHTQTFHSISHFILHPVLRQGRNIFQGRFSRMRSNLFVFSFHQQHVPLNSYGSCLSLVLCRPVTTILPSILPSITCFKRQFLRNMWPVDLACLLFTLGRIFHSCLRQPTLPLSIRINTGSLYHNVSILNYKRDKDNVS